MRRVLLALLMICVVASLQAITINWQIYASEYTWDQSLTAESVHFVYSQSGDLTAEQVATGKYTGYKTTGMGTSTTVTAIDGATASTLGASASVVGTGAVESPSHWTPTDQDYKSFASLTLDGSGFGNGYYYLVVFDPNDATNGIYAVSKAVQYTGTPATDVANGIYDTTVDGAAPEIGDFVEIPWMGGTWTAAITPEPTALALLALGVAGLALRRKL